jgi:transposase InsO family protein
MIVFVEALLLVKIQRKLTLTVLEKLMVSLDLINYDICAPMTTPSMNGCLYYIIFIDDCSCKTWIYFLKTKDESFSKYQDFKNLVENQTGRHIRVFRIDNGKEFDSHKYDDLFQVSRIKRELIVPYNPQQNGVVERKNRTICEAAKAMMYDQNLSLSLWAEAASTAVYIQNRFLIKPRKRKLQKNFSPVRSLQLTI